MPEPGTPGMGLEIGPRPRTHRSGFTYWLHSTSNSWGWGRHL